MTWTPLKLIEWTTEFFKKKEIPNPRLDAELLLAHALQCKRIDLYMQFEKVISEKDRAQYKALIERRATREPLQYIIGETEFWGLKIKVTPDVLIPRPETELLVEEVINRLSPPLNIRGGQEGISDISPQPPLTLRGGDFTILEIGTGSGCIPIALAKNLPGAQITATDISAKALEIARHNVAQHGLEKHITLQEANLAPWDDFEKKQTQFDIIVSNPPYIPNAEIPTLQKEVSQYEPHLALAGGETGLEIVTIIHERSIHFLKPEGILIMEIGEGQANILKNKYERHPTLPYAASIKDYSGIERIVLFKKT